MKFRACIFCNRVCMGSVARCNDCFERGALMPSECAPTHERNANTLIACVVLLLTLAMLFAINVPEQPTAAHSFGPSWSGEPPQALQPAGVRGSERQEQ